MSDTRKTTGLTYAEAGVDIDAGFTVRTAAELLLETRNVRDVAQLLTDVPERTGVGEARAANAR